MLKHIQLQGYKSIKDLDLELRNINILIGANGAGKSNLISFFQLVNNITIYPGNLELFVAISGGANSLLFDGVRVTDQISASLVFETELSKTDYSIILSYALNDTLIFKQERVRAQDLVYNSVEDWKGNLYELSNNWIDLGKGHREAKIFDLLPPSPKIQNGHIYQFNTALENARIRQRCDVHDNLDLKRDAANLPALLLRLRNNHRANYLRIVETIQLLAPFFDDFVLEPINNSVMLQWRERRTDAIFSSYQASDGTLRAMALVALLLRPETELPDIIILDEPELGLHPYAMNIIAGLIQSISHRTQIIIATQSPFLIDCFQPEDIIVVERKNRESIFHRLEPEKLQDWLEDYSLSELWHKNVIGGRPSK
jgi:predicted ATPase